MKQLPEPQDCFKCGVKPDQKHKYMCDWALCKHTGHQFIQCSKDYHVNNNCQATIYPGYYHGVIECHEYDLFTDADSFWGISPDLNKLVAISDWNVERQRYIMRNNG